VRRGRATGAEKSYGKRNLALQAEMYEGGLELPLPDSEWGVSVAAVGEDCGEGHKPLWRRGFAGVWGVMGIIDLDAPMGLWYSASVVSGPHSAFLHLE
jgi:hypothetical protein